MTTLRERLADLAEDAPEALSAPGLWDRGTAYRRRRRRGAAVVVACAMAALLGLGAVTWQRSPQTTELLPADGAAGLPDHLYAPSPWLPGTDDAGPLGQVAVLLLADRDSLVSTRHGQIVGVSATTGAYRFLDLPNAAPAQDPAGYALSPDGRHVAYALEGQAGGGHRRVVVGVAVYDTSTGAVRRDPISSDYGLQVQSLTWAGDSALVFGYNTNTDATGNVGRVGPTMVWDLTDASPRALPGVGSGSPVRAAGPGFVVVDADRGFRVLDLTTGTTLGRVNRAGGYVDEPVANRSGDRVAIISGGRIPGPVSTYAVIHDKSATTPSGTALVPSAQHTYAVLGWADDEHLGVTALPHRDGTESTVDVLDVVTGARRTVMTFDGAETGYNQALATELLARPAVHAVPPPRPLDHRTVAGLGVGVVVLALLALVVWRRRVRP